MVNYICKRCGKVYEIEEGIKAPRFCNATEGCTGLIIRQVREKSSNDAGLKCKFVSKYYLCNSDGTIVLDISEDRDSFIGRKDFYNAEKIWRHNISREHICIQIRGDKLFVKDISTNGVRVNGQAIEKDRVLELSIGDQITFDIILNDITLMLKER